jgi:predicted ATPase/DNA-binding CsgD family transcriptional regulator
MPATGREPIGNLPAELTSFDGRRRELADVRRLLADARLVTLTGIGGTGKTRLAVRAGGQLRRAFADGVWFVDLTELRNPGPLNWQVSDPDVLAHLVAIALGIQERGGGVSVRHLTDHLADRQTLLVLDNCEHLLPACALLADALLRACPGLRILATSREPLTVDGETVLAVPPLPTTQPGLTDLELSESVLLFVTRAQSVTAGFELTVRNRAAVTEICHRLDGLPLAIELAAARIRVLAPQQILDRLTDRFALLRRATRQAPARQQTLRACTDWSFELCSKPERLLWARLTVFVGGFELDAVEGVCADDQLPAADLLDLVSGLVEKSILIRDDGSEGPGATARFRMLETIRDYGQEKLREAGQDAGLRRRHCDWYQQLLTRARAEWAGDRQASWMARLRYEHPNLRAAVEFCLAEPGDAETAMRLAVTLPGLYWRARGLFGEGRRWLDRALAQATAQTALRARALLVNSHLAFAQGDAGTGRRLLAEGESLTRRLDSSVELAYADYIRGFGALYANDLPVAVETLDRARVILSGLPDRDTHLYLMVLCGLCRAGALAGEYERAAAVLREMLAIVESRSAGFHRSITLWDGGLIAFCRGDLRQAAAQVTEALRLKRRWVSHDRYNTAQCLELLAWITAGQGRHRRAAVLSGAADSLWSDLGTPIASYLHLVGRHDACERQIRAAVGDATFADSFDHGRRLEYEDAVAYALEESRQPAPTARTDAPVSLTRREREVADLVAQGLSNKEVAGRLVISQRTAESHVEHILDKLGFTSRAQVAAWVTTQQSAGHLA